MILKDRIYRQWKFNYSLVRMVCDWTVLVYIFVPFSILGIFLYLDFYQTVETSIFVYVPVTIVLFLCMYISSLSTFRTFLQGADRLFLITRLQQMKYLKIGGWVYSLSGHLLKVVAILLLLSPILIKIHSFTIIQLIAFGFICFHLGITKTFLTLKLEKKWVAQLLYIVACVVVSFLYWVSPIIAILVTTLTAISWQVVYYYSYCCKLAFFAQLVDIEQEQFYKGQSLIFQSNQELSYLLDKEVKKISLLGFKNSKRLFANKEHYFLETVIKTWIRRKQFYRPTLIYFFMCIFLILIVPLWVKLISIGLAILIYRSIIDNLFLYVSNQPFMKLYFKDENVFNLNAKQLKRRGTIVTFFMFGIIFIISIF